VEEKEGHRESRDEFLDLVANLAILRIISA